MMTRESLAALTDEQVNERIARELMDLPLGPCDGDIEEEYEGWVCLKCGHRGDFDDSSKHDYQIPAFSKSLHWAWQVVQRITRIPQSKAEAEVAAQMRFMFAFREAAYTLVCSNEQELARWICEHVLLAWHDEP